jgi:hypothetical protein
LQAGRLALEIADLREVMRDGSHTGRLYTEVLLLRTVVR